MQIDPALKLDDNSEAQWSKLIIKQNEEVFVQMEEEWNQKDAKELRNIYPIFKQLGNKIYSEYWQSWVQSLAIVSKKFNYLLSKPSD